ncbi:monoheme cytochrome C [Cellulophaga sp. F20128]|uniref:monoheme cytochrome C n=1 Tax=Cellulophaga sp. F20128 TaxID=2926413 RepID=UPI001FF6D57C|nr:monoheme cytochrome C [Cellulophaga sp. F20128]MCK0157836.1 monoheme cytochrome C [Cellulophaga sp. F20128]
MAGDNEFKAQAKQVYRMLVVVWCIVLLGAVFAAYVLVDPSLSAFKDKSETELSVVRDEVTEDDWDKVENGIHLRTGFVEGEGLLTVVNNCTSCHSAKLVTQNRMSKERWVATIRWMQETQNLWDLGENEEVIVNYLAKNYAPTTVGRRENLQTTAWYDLQVNAN